MSLDASGDASARGFVLPLPLRLVQGVAVGFFAAKVALLVGMRPFMDETYYFLWGQHPALSYYDHPSLIGWTQGLSTAVFGWNLAAVREPVFLTLCGDLFVLYLFARRLGGAAWRDYFWLSAALFLTLPITLLATGIAVPDHLLVLLALAALYFLHVFLDGYEAGEPRWRWLYAAALAIGLAALAKYYGILIGVAVVVALLVTPRYRRLLLNPHIYAGIAVVLILQAPVLVWNLQHDLASFAFALGRSGSGAWWQFAETPRFLIDVVVAASPFLVWPMLRVATAPTSGPARPAQALMWVSSLLFFAVSTVTATIIHWNLQTYVAATPFLAGVIRSRLLLIAQFIYATVFLVAFAINYAVIPLGTLFGFGDQATGWGYGWPDIAVGVAQLEQSAGASLVVTTDYALAGELGFALHDPDVTSLSPNTEAFDFWSNPQAVPGATAVIVADNWRALPQEIRDRFADVETAGMVDASAYGRLVDRYTLYVGHGFRPAPAAP